MTAYGTTNQNQRLLSAARSNFSAGTGTGTNAESYEAFRCSKSVANKFKPVMPMPTIEDKPYSKGDGCCPTKRSHVRLVHRERRCDDRYANSGSGERNQGILLGDYDPSREKLSIPMYPNTAANN